jgi:hypothetical protein
MCKMIQQFATWTVYLAIIVVYDNVCVCIIITFAVIMGKSSKKLVFKSNTYFTSIAILLLSFSLVRACHVLPQHGIFVFMLLNIVLFYSVLLFFYNIIHS